MIILEVVNRFNFNDSVFVFYETLNPCPRKPQLTALNLSSPASHNVNMSSGEHVKLQEVLAKWRPIAVIIPAAQPQCGLCCFLNG